MEKMLYYCYFK